MQAFKAVHGINATHVPIGFASNMDLLPLLPEAERDIDVLFFGSSNPVRTSLIQALWNANTSLHIQWPSSLVVGEALSSLIRRSKVHSLLLLSSRLVHPRISMREAIVWFPS